jgi:SAM-dependent methyltransferase
MKFFNKLLFILILIGFQQASFSQDVPYVPSTPEVVNGMLTLAKVTSDDIVYDLGCGDGRIVVAAARDFGARGVGVDSNPDRIKESNDNAKANNVQDKVKFIEQNLFEADIKDATVIAIYLLNSVNLKLRPKLFDELKPGTRIVSHAFSMDDWEPEAQEVVDGRDIYLWIIPENASGTWTSSANNEQNGNTFNLTQQFQNVSGTLTMGGNSYNIKEAKLDGSKLTFSAAGSGDDNSDIQFEGEINEDQIRGRIISPDDNVNQEITAVRQNGTKKPLDPAVAEVTPGMD